MLKVPPLHQKSPQGFPFLRSSPPKRPTFEGSVRLAFEALDQLPAPALGEVVEQMYSQNTAIQCRALPSGLARELHVDHAVMLCDAPALKSRWLKQLVSHRDPLRLFNTLCDAFRHGSDWIEPLLNALPASEITRSIANVLLRTFMEWECAQDPARQQKAYDKLVSMVPNAEALLKDEFGQMAISAIRIDNAAALRIIQPRASDAWQSHFEAAMEYGALEIASEILRSCQPLRARLCAEPTAHLNSIFKQLEEEDTFALSKQEAPFRLCSTHSSDRLAEMLEMLLTLPGPGFSDLLRQELARKNKKLKSPLLRGVIENVLLENTTPQASSTRTPRAHRL